ncbi:MAG: class I SAM-dependent methyltransferase [Desulfocapsa sp.]|nr:class I SAM-dependent methyltransferase [Desulfocapsa sp.]
MNYLREVRKQYENYPYPFRDPKDEKKRLLTTEDSFLEKINHYCYAGKQDFNNYRALVAGGGTGSAAIFLAEQLCRRKGSEVVYLDISKKSMEVAQKRAAIRDLDNITWVHGSLLELPELELGTFNYINCVGVLHHLEDHHAGLQALGSVLAEDGCMGIMVYGRNGRTPVYQMQELMRLVNEEEEDMQVKVENTKRLLADLPPSNFFKRSEKEWLSEVEQYGDIGIYDLFLHSHDHGFDVLELYDWVESCGFHLIEFIGSKFESKIGYEPQTFIRHPALLKTIAKLPRPKQQAIAELLSGLIQRHSFYCSRKTKTIARLDDPDDVPFFLNPVPLGIPEMIEKSPGRKISLMSPDQISLQFLPGKHSAAIFRHLDGRRSLKTIFNRVRKEGHGTKVSNSELLEDFRPTYDILSNIGWLLLRHHSVQAFTSAALLQERVGSLRL